MIVVMVVSLVINFIGIIGFIFYKDYRDKYDIKILKEVMNHLYGETQARLDNVNIISDLIDYKFNVKGKDE